MLHDAAAAARAPTIVVTRAHAVLRARRRLAAGPPGYALSAPRFDVLRGAAVAAPPIVELVPDPIGVEDDLFVAELADIDALLARTTKIIAGQAGSQEDRQDASQDARRDVGHGARSSADAVPPNEHRIDGSKRRDRLTAWRDVLDSTRHDPPVLAAARAVAAAAFDDSCAAAKHELARPPRRRRPFARPQKDPPPSRSPRARQKLARRAALRRRHYHAANHLDAAIAAITCAAETGLADHNRFLAWRQQLQQHLAGRRTTSKLPALIELVLRAPVVSTGTIAAKLKISTRAAQDLVAGAVGPPSLSLLGHFIALTRILATPHRGNDSIEKE